MAQFARRILCIGAGHVGGPTMSVIAARCPQYEVNVVDTNPSHNIVWNADVVVYDRGYFSYLLLRPYSSAGVVGDRRAAGPSAAVPAWDRCWCRAGSTGS